MFSILPLPIQSHIQTYHPTISSPLSSSPLRSSPPRAALSPRTANLTLPTPTRANNSRYEDGDAMMSSPPNSPTKIFTYAPKSQSPCSKTRSQSRQAQNRTTPPTSASSRSPGSRSASSRFSARPSKSNPLLHKNGSEGDGRETRRKLFLKKVKEGAEDKRWKARGGEEEMMRTIWLMEERRREAGLRQMSEREAGSGGGVNGEVDYLSLDDVIAEEVEVWEERELERLIELQYAGEQAQGMGMGGEKENETPYGSDDDEYDSIFMDVIQEEIRMSSQQEQEQPQRESENDMMDMS